MALNLGIGQTILEVGIIIEIVLIALLIVATYVTKLFLYWRDKRHLKIENDVNKYFKKLIETNQKLDVAHFNHKWQDISIIYPLTIDFSKKYASHPAWNAIKQDLLDQILLPLARKAAYSRHWQDRFYAAETFTLKSDPIDEEAIIKLTNDKVPLVYLHAVSAAIHSCSESAIQATITRMSKLSWLTQSIYLEPFEHATPEVAGFVVSRLKSAKEPEVRTACYTILLKCKPTKITWDINKDLKSDYYQLRLVSLKYVSKVDEQAAIPLLIEKLTDDHWEVKVVALHRLANIQPQQAIPSIGQCLKDSDWWVKITAAQALKSMGEPGEEMLKAQAPDLDQIPFKAAERIPHAMW